MDGTGNDGSTALHFAAREGYVNVVSKLLDLGANPLLRNAENATALHMAAGGGRTVMVARLIDCGIDVNVRDNDGATALHRASGADKVDCVRILLEEGCDINAVTHDGFTPLRFAACAHDSSVLAYFLDKEMGNPHENHDVQGNLLHSAARNGRTTALQLLVGKGLDLASTVASTGETAMHLAARKGKSEAVTWLLDHGAGLDVRDGEGMEPSVAAVVRSKGLTRHMGIRGVLEAIAVSTNGNRGLQAVFRGRGLIHLASSRGLPDCVELLVSKGAAVDSKTDDEFEETAMHRAASHKHVEVAKTLAKVGATVDIRDSGGETPLHIAASKSHLEMVVLLLNLGASCDVADEEGITPLGAAATAGSVVCCSLLVARGANMANRDNFGRTALGAALESHRSRRTEQKAVVKLLIGLGCPVTEDDVDAASHGSLTEFFAKVINARMDSGTPAQQLAVATSMVAPTVLSVRLSRRSGTSFSKRHLSSSAPGIKGSSKVYNMDGARLRHAVLHLEGAEEAGKCLLLKLLLSPTEGWGAASYRGIPATDASRAIDPRGMPHSAGSSAEPGPPDLAEGSASAALAEDGVSPSCPPRTTTSATEVCLVCNGDDFDEAGFEAVMEYVRTGQVSRVALEKRVRAGVR